MNVSQLFVRGAVAALILAGCSRRPEAERSVALDAIEQRIHFYSGKVEQRPRLYPVYVQLATAYFDKARDTGNPKWLADARRLLDQSVSIVATHEAFVTRARLSNYAHRFEDAVRWGRRALPPRGSLDVPDPGVVAILVEAHSSLGQYAEARALLPPEGPAKNFFAAVAFAQFFTSQRRFEEAARAYATAAELAHAEDAIAASAWARAMAAGVFLDAGRVDLAHWHLDAARRSDPQAIVLRLHEAEWQAAQGRTADSLAIYESLLRERPSDSEIHAAASRIAARLGRTSSARRHFEAAERGFRAAIDAGEVYTLGALAQLYCDFGIRPAEAVALAERNVLFRRDREAWETLSAARQFEQRLRDR